MKKRILLGIILFIFMLSCANETFGFGWRKQKAVVVQAVKHYTLEDYMKDMERQIKSNWAPPENNFRFKTVVEFKILKDGTIKNSKIIQTSGNKDFDQKALLALNNTQKLAPLPNNVLGESIDISFTFERLSYLVQKDRYDK